jgi:hypothetical protein
MDTIIIFAIIWYLFLMIMIADEGSRRKIGAWGAIGVSILYTPLFGILFVIASERKKQEFNLEGTAKPKRGLGVWNI